MNWPKFLTKLSPLRLSRAIFPIRKFVVREDSMLPTLRPGDMILTNKWAPISSGQIVVAKTGHRLLLKRVERVRRGEVFLIGDNPEHSRDSRQFGWIPKRNVLGVVFFVKRFAEGE